MNRSNLSVTLSAGIVFLGAVIAVGYAFRMRMKEEAAKVAFSQMKATPARPYRPVITELPPWPEKKEDRLVPVVGKFLFAKEGDKEKEGEREKEKREEEEKESSPRRGGDFELEIPKGSALIREIEDVARKIDKFDRLEVWERMATTTRLYICQLGLGLEPDKRLQDDRYILHYQHVVAAYVRGWVKLVDVKEEQF